MFIELEPIFNNEGSCKEFEYEFVPEDCAEIAVARVKGSVKNQTGIVSLTAEVSFLIDALCDRCAAPVKEENTIDISHILVSQLNDSDNDNFFLIDSMHFNLDELIREDILLSLPTKILCRDDCKGLCPYCGANLNEKQCGCKKPVDPRLEALKKFLD